MDEIKLVLVTYCIQIMKSWTLVTPTLIITSPCVTRLLIPNGLINVN